MPRPVRPKQGDLRVWWVSGVPSGPRYRLVNSPENAIRVLRLFAVSESRNGKGAKEAVWMGQIRRPGAQAGQGSQERSRGTEETQAAKEVTSSLHFLFRRFHVCVK